MRGFLLAATAVTALLAGGAAANATDCIGGYKTLGNQVIIRCTDDDYSAGFYSSAPSEEPMRPYASRRVYNEPVYEDYGYNGYGYDEPIITGSIGGGRYYDDEPRYYPRRNYGYQSRWDDCRPGWGGWLFGC